MPTAARAWAGALLGLALGACSGGADQIHDAATLPNRISVCGRTWVRDALAQQQTAEAIRAASGLDPMIVDPGLFAPCPPGPCTPVAQNAPCDTVVFVRVGKDLYVEYSLSGGP